MTTSRRLILSSLRRLTGYLAHGLLDLGELGLDSGVDYARAGLQHAATGRDAPVFDDLQPVDPIDHCQDVVTGGGDCGDVRQVDAKADPLLIDNTPERVCDHGDHEIAVDHRLLLDH